MTRPSVSFDRVRSFAYRHRLVPALVAVVLLLVVWAVLSLSIADDRSKPLADPSLNLRADTFIATLASG